MAVATETVTDKTQEQNNQAVSGTQKTQVQSIEFSETADSQTTGIGSSIDILLDMEVPVTVVIGKAEVTIQRLLQLNQGSVLKLDKSVDAPVDLYLKDAKFATGTVVVVENKFAVRIKEVLSPDNAPAADKH
jgi:flagellar motor switch protein FliN